MSFQLSSKRSEN